MKKTYCIIATTISLVAIGIFVFNRFHSNTYVSENVVSMNHTRPIEELKKLVLSKGDTIAYHELRIAYLNVDYSEQEYLFYSIIMADKYKHPRAYYYVYRSLTSISKWHLGGKIDDKTKVFALKYLKGGVELNDSESTRELSNLYLEGKYVTKDSILGKKLEEKIKSCW